MDLESGKHYRITCEGEYRKGYNVFMVDGIGVSASKILTIESLPDPLPSTPGSVISVNGFAYARTGEDVNDKHWAGLMGTDRGGTYSDAEFADDEVTVLFDAGA